MCPPMWTYWRNLANTIELVLPSAHPSPQPKRQIDRFCRFCTAHDRKSLYFTMCDPFPPNCSFSWGDLDPHLIRDSLSESEPAHNPNGITISSAVFAQVTQNVPILDNGPPFTLKIVPSHAEIGTPISTMVPWAQPNTQPKRHLNRFSRFFRAH